MNSRCNLIFRRREDFAATQRVNEGEDSCGVKHGHPTDALLLRRRDFLSRANSGREQPQ
jgi:hypothetical protein